MNIGVLGAGSWGTTLAVLLREKGHTVSLWSYRAEDAENIRRTRSNLAYLPDLRIPEEIDVRTDLAPVARGRDMLLLSTPSQYLRSVLEQLDGVDIGNCLFVNVAKGIERETLLRMSQLVEELLPGVGSGRYAVLSGPSHAEEVSVKIPTSVVVASTSTAAVQAVQSVFMTRYFRVYGSSDVLGVELGGSLKNVIAIGAGIIDGAGFGDNTKAALITRGIAEMRRLGVAAGADPHTFAGLSGLGDLIVTCMSRHSRNRLVGERIGRGEKLSDIVQGMTMVAEGIGTTESAHALALASGVEMPITHQVHRVLFEGKDPARATEELMTRQARDEVWG